MRITAHIGFSKTRRPIFWKYIQDNRIPADHSEGEDVAAIDIHSEDPHWPWITDYAATHNMVCLFDMEFTKKELREAEWLSVRTTWRYGYPEPSDDYKYKDITYTKDSYCNNCGTGLTQIDCFRIKKTPKWGQRHFYAPFWIEDEFFISETAKALLEHSNLNGITFLPVKNKKGTETLADVWQMVIPTVLEDGLIEDDSFLKKVTLCPCCGKKKYCKNGKAKVMYYKRIFQGAPDFIKSGDCFGGMPKSSCREIIISQKAYRFLVDNKLDKGLLFYPIALI